MGKKEGKLGVERGYEGTTKNDPKEGVGMIEIKELG